MTDSFGNARDVDEAMLRVADDEEKVGVRIEARADLDAFAFRARLACRLPFDDDHGSRLPASIVATGPCAGPPGASHPRGSR